jgi:hypothetical protein
LAVVKRVIQSNFSNYICSPILLKDLGKKWFAFLKIGLDAKEMIKKLN